MHKKFKTNTALIDKAYEEFEELFNEVGGFELSVSSSGRTKTLEFLADSEEDAAELREKIPVDFYGAYTIVLYVVPREESGEEDITFAAFSPPGKI